MISDADIERAWSQWSAALQAGHYEKLPDVQRCADEMRAEGVDPDGVRAFAERAAQDVTDAFVLAYRRTYGTWCGPAELFAAVFPHAFVAGVKAATNAREI